MISSHISQLTLNDLHPFLTNLGLILIPNPYKVLAHVPVFKGLLLKTLFVVFRGECTLLDSWDDVAFALGAIHPHGLDSLGWSFALCHCCVHLPLKPINQQLQIRNAVVVIHVLRVFQVYWLNTFRHFTRLLLWLFFLGLLLLSCRLLSLLRSRHRSFHWLLPLLLGSRLRLLLGLLRCRRRLDFFSGRFFVRGHNLTNSWFFDSGIFHLFFDGCLMKCNFNSQFCSFKRSCFLEGGICRARQ